MKKHPFSSCLFILLAAGLAFAGAGQDKSPALKKFKPEELAPQYRRWLLEEAVYIIHPKERDVFLQLQNDRERELFIEAFWKHRDPNPATPVNEFKEEHYKRIAHANKHFGRFAPGPGWRTDRGRIHIILGEPQQTRTYDNEAEVVPVEIWFYQGFAEYGLPNGFYCVFYRKDEGSDFELYSPVAHGPGKLLRHREFYSSFDPYDPLAAFYTLKEVAPDIAQKSLSLIAGEEHMVQQPTMASEVLMANIGLYPHKRVKEEYAEKFLRYKEFVEVDYSVNYIDSQSLFAVTLDPSGRAFVQYLVEPRRLSVESVEGRFFTLIEVNVRVSDKQGRTIFQFERSYPLNLNRDEVAALRTRPFSLQGMFALAQGRYDVVMILKNSAGKEFTTAEAEIYVPAPPTSLAMSPLFLGYGSRAGLADSRRKAFQFNDLQLLVAPMNQFSPRETMTALFQLLGPEEERNKAAAARFEVIDESGGRVKSWSLALDPALRSGFVLQTLILEELKPAHYSLSVRVEDHEGRPVLSDSRPFSVSSVPVIPRPLVHSEPVPEPTSPFTSFLLGGQYFNKGETDVALGLLRDAYMREPANQRYAVGYGRALMSGGRYGEARAVLEPFREAEKPEAEVFELLGLAYQAEGDCARAVECFVGYLTRFGSKLAVFNSLGECYSRLDDAENALFAWEKSLEMNPDQPEVRRRVEELKKRRR